MPATAWALPYLGLTIRIDVKFFHKLAAPQGFEPQFPGSEPGVLPLNDEAPGRPGRIRTDVASFKG
jgi:hypothetical protein